MNLDFVFIASLGRNKPVVNIHTFAEVTSSIKMEMCKNTKQTEILQK